ncbi:MAG: hypothetical protein HKM93_21855 [Desulfobacteraceae bacterium]|nr:hypothetical protein [Desulfobacteraceae bacterium]
MIQDNRHITIDASSATVFHLIDTMPNKFPVYALLETKPFLFLRLLLVDGFRSAWQAVKIKAPVDELKFEEGDTLGPFLLDERIESRKYFFTLKSFFFNCRTGYVMADDNTSTILHFDLIAENPNLVEKIWWFFVKPIHGLFANKVLSNLKNRVERIECE